MNPKARRGQSTSSGRLYSGQQSMVFQGDPSHTTYLAHSYPLGWDNGNPVTGHARISP